MKVENLKSKLIKMNVAFNQDLNTLSFELNKKSYEAHITINNNVCGYSFNTRIFETFNRVIRHSRK